MILNIVLCLIFHNIAVFLQQAQIAAKLEIPLSDVKNVIIWGNHSSTQFPDLRHATAVVKGKEMPVYDAINDDDYLKGNFIAVSRGHHIHLAHIICET